jgi:hypothetical protein
LPQEPVIWNLLAALGHIVIWEDDPSRPTFEASLEVLAQGFDPSRRPGNEDQADMRQGISEAGKPALLR